MTASVSAETRPFLSDAIAHRDTITGLSGFLAQPTPSIDDVDPLLLNDAKEKNDEELQNIAEYVNMDNVPDRAPTFPPESYPSIGPMQNARFLQLRALNPKQPWSAYELSIYGEGTRHSKQELIQMGRSAEYVLHARRRTIDRVALHDSEAALYQICLSGGLDLWMQTVLRFIQRNPPEDVPLPIVFRDPTRLPEIIECAGTCMVTMATAIRAIEGKATLPEVRMAVVRGVIRTQVLAIKDILELSQRGE